MTSSVMSCVMSQVKRILPNVVFVLFGDENYILTCKRQHYFVFGLLSATMCHVVTLKLHELQLGRLQEMQLHFQCYCMGLNVERKPSA